MSTHTEQSPIERLRVWPDHMLQDGYLSADSSEGFSRACFDELERRAALEPKRFQGCETKGVL